MGKWEKLTTEIPSAAALGEGGEEEQRDVGFAKAITAGSLHSCLSHVALGLTCVEPGRGELKTTMIFPPN